MITPTDVSAENRINHTIEQIKTEYGAALVGLLKDANHRHLKGKGKVSTLPTIERNSVRWSLVWTRDQATFNLSVVVAIADDGSQARVDRVWVHRHAATPFDYDGHTPTTHMRRLTGLSIPEIKAAVEVEFE